MCEKRHRFRQKCQINIRHVMYLSRHCSTTNLSENDHFIVLLSPPLSKSQSSLFYTFCYYQLILPPLLPPLSYHLCPHLTPSYTYSFLSSLPSLTSDLPPFYRATSLTTLLKSQVTYDPHFPIHLRTPPVLYPPLHLLLEFNCDCPPLPSQRHYTLGVSVIHYIFATKLLKHIFHQQLLAGRMLVCPFK